MSAATFRRLGLIEQARTAIQEAEVLDEENANVWVQVSGIGTLFITRCLSYNFYEAWIVLLSPWK